MYLNLYLKYLTTNTYVLAPMSDVYVCTVQNQNKLDVWDAETSRDPLHSVKAHTRAVRLAVSKSLSIV